MIKKIEEFKNVSDRLLKLNGRLSKKNSDMRNLIQCFFTSKEPKRLTPEMYAKGYKKDKYNRKILSK